MCYCTETLKVHQPAHLLYNPNTLTRGSTDKSYPRSSLDDGFDPRWSFRLGMGNLRIGSDAQVKWRNIGAFRWERDTVVPCWRVCCLRRNVLLRFYEDFDWEMVKRGDKRTDTSFVYQVCRVPTH